MLEERLFAKHKSCGIYGSRLVRLESGEDVLLLVDQRGELCWPETYRNQLGLRRLDLGLSGESVNGIYTIQHAGKAILMVTTTSLEEKRVYMHSYFVEKYVSSDEISEGASLSLSPIQDLSLDYRPLDIVSVEYEGAQVLLVGGSDKLLHAYEIDFRGRWHRGAHRDAAKAHWETRFGLTTALTASLPLALLVEGGPANGGDQGVAGFSSGLLFWNRRVTEAWDGSSGYFIDEESEGDVDAEAAGGVREADAASSGTPPQGQGPFTRAWSDGDLVSKCSTPDAFSIAKSRYFSRGHNRAQTAKQESEIQIEDLHSPLLLIEEGEEDEEEDESERAVEDAGQSQAHENDPMQIDSLAPLEGRGAAAKAQFSGAALLLDGAVSCLSFYCPFKGGKRAQSIMGLSGRLSRYVIVGLAAGAAVLVALEAPEAESDQPPAPPFLGSTPHSAIVLPGAHQHGGVQAVTAGDITSNGYDDIIIGYSDGSLIIASRDLSVSRGVQGTKAAHRSMRRLAFVEVWRCKLSFPIFGLVFSRHVFPADVDAFSPHTRRSGSGSSEKETYGPQECVRETLSVTTAKTYHIFIKRDALVHV